MGALSVAKIKCETSHPSYKIYNPTMSMGCFEMVQLVFLLGIKTQSLIKWLKP